MNKSTEQLREGQVEDPGRKVRNIKNAGLRILAAVAITGASYIPFMGENEASTRTAWADGVANSCRDGELIFVHAADEGDVLRRVPIGEAERADIIEISWPGGGFGGLDRAIVVVPRLGPVWSLNARHGATTIAARGFCGSNEEVTAWVLKAHVPSLQQASRDENGNQPAVEEFNVVRFNFEARAMRVVRRATADGVASPEDIMTRFDLSFHEGANRANVPLHVE